LRTPTRFTSSRRERFLALWHLQGVTDPTPKPAAARVGTVVWALIIVALVACSATGVVTLFGSKFGPGFPISADALAGDPAPVRERPDAGVRAPPQPAAQKK